MSGDPAGLRFLSLRQGFTRSDLSSDEVYREYLLLGGMMGPAEFEAALLGLLVIEPHQHNIVALLLNRFFLDQPRCYLVGYAS